MGSPNPCSCLRSAPPARKRETQRFCLTPRLSLQLYYIPLLAPEVGSWERGGPRGRGGGQGWGVSPGEGFEGIRRKNWGQSPLGCGAGQDLEGFCPRSHRHGP